MRFNFKPNTLPFISLLQITRSLLMSIGIDGTKPCGNAFQLCAVETGENATFLVENNFIQQFNIRPKTSAVSSPKFGRVGSKF
jgi:hypothetical protein